LNRNFYRLSLTLTYAAVFALVPVNLAMAQDATGSEAETETPPVPVRPGSEPRDTNPPKINGAATVDINYVDADLLGLVEYFARATGRNFILGETRELQGKKVTIISNQKVTPGAAYEAFLSALELHGFTTVKVGDTHKIIKAQEAQQSPGPINQGGAIRATDNYVTQVIQLENVSVTDVRQIIDNLVSPNAKVLAYAPTNSLILTDSGNNLRRIFKLVTELDIAAPRSSLKIYPIVFADAAEIMQLIEELYGTAEETTTDSRSSRSTAASRRRTSRARRDEPTQSEGVTAGKESKYIQKVLSDERTNSLIVLANDQGHDAVRDLMSKIDIDVDPTSRSQIYVYRLEHAKAEDIVQVLQDLSQENGRGGGKGSNQAGNSNSRVSAARARAQEPANEKSGNEASGAIAAFDSGMRIAADENTNALVIISSKDDYAVVKRVIDELDVKRKQVFVDAVIMELSSTDTNEFNLAYHTPFSAGGESAGIMGGQFGTNSLGFDITGLATGLAMGVFGQSIDVPVVDPTGTAQSVSIPAFGIVVQALKTSQNTNIVSAPSLLTLDNEEATISVGRRIPFPTSNGLNSFGSPVMSFQREDVDLTLKITPRVNSEDFVTLELQVQVQEIEEGQGNVVQQGGFITSNREVETVALVGDNQTVVIGGLVGSTDSESESKIPILGDLPIIGALFRSRSKSTRRTNLMIFLTPHIIDDEEDMYEVLRVKEAQRQEFMRRFYGKSQDEQFVEMQRLLQYSMNSVDRPSVYRGPSSIASTVTVNGEAVSSSTRAELHDEVERARLLIPGEGAGTLPTVPTQVDAGTSDSQDAGDVVEEVEGLSSPEAPAAGDEQDASDDASESEGENGDPSSSPAEE
jgi:general secretion pathway protein D